MKLSKIFLLSVAVLLLSCNSPKGKDLTGGELMVIDVAKEYPQKRVNLADIADLEYIKLETNSNSLISGFYNVAYDGNTIIIVDESLKEFLLFDNTGKYINKINRVGRGGEEYQEISRCDVDFEKRLIYVYEASSESTIKAYDFEGNFKGKYEMPFNLTLTSSFRVIDNEFIVRNASGVTTYGDMPGGIKINGSDGEVAFDSQPYRLVSIDDPKIVAPLDIIVDRNEPNTVALVNGLYVTIDILKTKDMFKTGDEVVISDFAKDTVYSYSKKGLKPIAIRNNSSTKEGLTILSSVTALSDNYMFLITSDKGLNATEDNLLDENKKTFMFDRESGEISKVNIYISGESKEEIYHYDWWQGAMLPKNMVVTPISALKLLTAAEEGALNAELNEIAKNIGEEDNPVLVFARFK